MWAMLKGGSYAEHHSWDCFFMSGYKKTMATATSASFQICTLRLYTQWRPVCTDKRNLSPSRHISWESFPNAVWTVLVVLWTIENLHLSGNGLNLNASVWLVEKYLWNWYYVFSNIPTYLGTINGVLTILSIT